MLALPVHVHKAGREPAQHGGIDAFAVHLDVAAPVRAQAPRNDQLVVRFDIHIPQQFGKPAAFCAEDGAHAARILAVADHGAVRLGAEHEVDAV